MQKEQAQINPNQCFICKGDLPEGPKMEKNYFCDEHSTILFPICETCNDDFNEDKCLFCEQQGKVQQPISQTETKQSPSNQNSEDSLIKAACIFPGQIYILTPPELRPVVTLNIDSMRVLAYSSFELIYSETSQHAILQTGGIENFMEVMTGMAINPSNVCQQLNIQENEGTLVMNSEVLPVKLKMNRYCHASKKINEGQVIIIGGQVNSNNYLSSCELIDLQSNEVKETVKLNKNRSQCSACIITNYLYVFGGFNGIQSQESSIERIPIDNLSSWELIQLQNSDKFNQLTGCILINSLKNQDEVYILGGSNGETASQNICLFNQKTNLMKLVQKMNAKRSYGTGLCLKGDGEQEEIVVVGYTEEGNILMEKCCPEQNSVQSEQIDIDEQLSLPLFVLSKETFVKLN